MTPGPKPLRGPILSILIAACGPLGAGAALGQALPAPALGLQRDVVLPDYPAYADYAEMARRLMSPRVVQRQMDEVARAGKTLKVQALDLMRERFLIYAPARMPKDGYGLLVFIPPSPTASLPLGWGPVLDRLGVIFVAAANSGNDDSVLERRVPLALAAAYNLSARYRVDPSRTYVAGFSGGSRVAMRVALAYPDVFSGAFLNAGSDPIGDLDTPLPSRDLMWAFQSSSRLVLATGQFDQVNVDKDTGARLSLQDWCVANVQAFTIAGAGHETANPGALARALALLDQKPATDPARLQRCRGALDQKLAAASAAADALERQGRRDRAEAQRERIDRQFGGLSARPGG